MSHPDVQAYIHEMLEKGYDENAIVVRRSESVFMRRDVLTWGVIKKAYRYKPVSSDYLPFDVLWFRDGKTLQHWGEDLFVIHAHQSNAELDAIYKAQET